MEQQGYTVFGVIGRAGAVWLHGLGRYALVSLPVFAALIVMTIARTVFMPAPPENEGGTMFTPLFFYNVLFAVPAVVLTTIWLTALFRAYFEEHFQFPYLGIDWTPVRLFLGYGVYLATVGIAVISAIAIGAIVLLVVWLLLVVGLNLDAPLSASPLNASEALEPGPESMIGEGISRLTLVLISLMVGLYAVWFAMRNTLLIPHIIEHDRLDPEAALDESRGWGWTLLVTYIGGILLFAAAVMGVFAVLMTGIGYAFGDPVSFRYIVIKASGWPTPIDPIWDLGQLAAAAVVLHIGYFLLYSAVVSLLATTYDAVRMHNQMDEDDI